MNTRQIEKRAEFLRQQLGGLIFAFPINEEDPYSKFAVVVYTGDGFRAFPEPLDVSEAAAGIASIVEGLEENGHRVDFDREVRFLVGATQLNGPNVLMRRLRENSRHYDYRRIDDMGGETAFTPRGFLKMGYLLMAEEGNVIGSRVMDEYCRFLAARRYGKPAAEIRKEV
ncbi:MAG TPA: hypothetical protein GX517_12070, partial [Alicyclobacillus sp.]|nr:hypothetical protein [Alicyclobacillus sp.]